MSPPRRWAPGGRHRFTKRPARTPAVTSGVPPEQRAALAAAWSARTGMPPELWLGPTLEPFEPEPDPTPPQSATRKDTT
jgi:hypothetical protein